VPTARECEEKQPMTTESVLHEAVGRTFIMAHMLGGSAGQAEAAVVKGIAFKNSKDPSADELCRGTARPELSGNQSLGSARKKPSPLFQSCHWNYNVSSIFRTILVSALCLRDLAGLPRETCARMKRGSHGGSHERFKLDTFAAAGLDSNPNELPGAGCS